MTDERCPAAFSDEDPRGGFPAPGVDSDKSKENEMTDERCPAAFSDEDPRGGFPAPGVDSDKSKENEMIDEHCPAATHGANFPRRAWILIDRRRRA